jgi:hypothetical protein
MIDLNDYTVRTKRIPSRDPRLKRHVRHDSRSLLYKAPESDLQTLKSVRHEVHIPTLDQGELGSCTGNASTLCMATGPFWTAPMQAALSTTDAAADEQYAVDVYSAATKLDSYTGTYPPNDTGSDGLSVAKVFVGRRLIPGYTHATSLNAAITALAKQPVIIGIGWHQPMYDPASDGRLTVTGSVVGGHEICLDELDVENQRAWIHNSWSQDWGLGGRAYLTWTDLGTLLADDGDCTVFTPPSQPAPVPTPTPDAKELYRAAAVQWLTVKHKTLNNVNFEKATRTYFGL